VAQNTTGLPNTQDYVLGRGILYFSSNDPVTGKPLAWRDLGNAPEVSISTETETLDHFTSRAGLRQLDKSVTLSVGMKVTFSLDEMNDQNLAMGVLGNISSFTNAAIAGFVEYPMVLGANMTLGRWYDIVNSSGARAYDVETANVTFKNDSTTQTLVEGTDYTLDLVNGRVFLRTTATLISNNVAMRCVLTADAGAKVVQEVRGLLNSGVVGALKFIEKNPANSDKSREWTFHQVTLKPSGDLSLIGDDWSQVTFEAAAEKNTLGFPDSPTLTIRSLAN